MAAKNVILGNFDSFIYTHIPKCGGTSFRAFVYEQGVKSGYSPSEMYIPGFNGIDNNKNIPELENSELVSLRTKRPPVIACHCKYGVNCEYDLGFRNPYYYVILRDPLKRFVSHYNFFYYKLGYGNCKGITLNDLDDKKLEYIVGSLANVQVAYIGNVIYPRIVGAKECFKIAAYNLRHTYNSFGILERLSDSLELLKNQLQLFSSLNVEDYPFRNSYTVSELLAPNKEVVDLIAKMNTWDIRLYEYALNLFNENHG